HVVPEVHRHHRRAMVLRENDGEAVLQLVFFERKLRQRGGGGQDGDEHAGSSTPDATVSQLTPLRAGGCRISPAMTTGCNGCLPLRGAASSDRPSWCCSRWPRTASGARWSRSGCPCCWAWSSRWACIRCTRGS